MKHVFLLFAISLIVLNTSAQIDKEPLPAVEAEVIQINSGNSVYGKVMDIQSDKGVEAASVQLLAMVQKPGTGGEQDSLIAAMLTKPNGDFNFANVPQFKNLKIDVSAVGYGPYSHLFSFADSTAIASKAVVQKDLGNLIMTRQNQRLQAVTIVAERPALRMGIDKKIFDVDKSLTSKGGTAVDVMKNIPSVSVDVDGNIELRNSSPTIFIDGRPTILTLDQIASDDIDRIELITNPSAKYDASSTGGIINIILKQNRRYGINGVVSLSAGTPERYSGNINLNLRQGKFNFFVSGNYNYGRNDSKSKSYRQSKSDGKILNYFNQNSINDRERKFTSARFGADYFLDNRNTITLSQGIVRGRFNTNGNQDQQYLDNNKVLDRYGDRVSSDNFKFDRNSTQLFYTHKFLRDGEKLDISANMNYGSNSSASNIMNTFYKPDGSLYTAPNIVNNSGANDNSQVTTKIDYVNPLGEDRKLEAGFRSYINNYTSYFNSFAINNNTETKLPLSNNYKYTENTEAVYITYTGKLAGIGYQAGLRGEYSRFSGTLIDSAKKFGYEYPSSLKDIWDGLFPSLYLSKKLNETEEIQLNYSRRIRRPNFWQLNPFIDINDPLNIQQGNPELKPEFTNSLEFNYSKTFENNSNFLGVIYYRNTLGDITRYSDTLSATQYERLQNAAVDPDAILNTFINSTSVNRAGVELTLQQKFGKNLDVTPSVNVAYRKVNARDNEIDLSNEGLDWNSKLTANYKINGNDEPSLFDRLSFQVTANYHSPSVIPQGRRLERFDADFAVRKDLFEKDKGSLTLSVNDIFNSHRYGVIYDTKTFYQETFSRRQVRSFRLTFSYKFGNSEFSIFKKNSDTDTDDGNGYD